MDHLPDGIDILESKSSGKLYVMIELLNFYQRKRCLLTKLQLSKLAHHTFKETEFEAALKLLNSLWTWKGLSPSSDNDYVIRHIGERRRNGTEMKRVLTMATDILNFFELEDKNLDISFLTEECEKIPSPVHEKEAMSDVYVLLHSCQEDYNTLTASMNDRDELITTQGKMLETLRKELNNNFQMLANIIKDKLPVKETKVTVSPHAGSDHISPVDCPENESDTREVEGTVNLEANSVSSNDEDEPTCSGDFPGVENNLREEVEGNVNNDSELEEGEIPPEDKILEASVEARNEFLYRSELYLKQMRDCNDRNQQQQQLLIHQQKRQLETQQHQQQQGLQQQRQQQQRLQQQRQQQQSQQQQRQQQQQLGSMDFDEMMTRARPPIQDRQQTPPLQGELQQTTRNAQQSSQFLKKKQKKNIILDQGDEDIPFTATREFFKYELFVTNLSSEAKIEDIKSHLSKKLGTDDIFLKPMSKSAAPYLSLGVFCRSQRNDLDFRMPGLWPRNTMIYKWNSKGGDTRGSNLGVSYQGHSRYRGSPRASNRSHLQGYQDNDGRRSNAANGYRYRTSDQQ